MRDELRAAYEERFPLLQELAASLERETRRQFDGIPHIDRISFRAKGVESFFDKVGERRLDPAYEEPLVEVEDQVGGRILVFFISDVDPAREQAERLSRRSKLCSGGPRPTTCSTTRAFTPSTASRPPMKPVGWDERDDQPWTFELHIRTLFQHAYAEPQHDLAYKPETQPSDEIRRELAWVAASSWGADQALERVRVELAEGLTRSLRLPAGTKRRRRPK